MKAGSNMPGRAHTGPEGFEEWVARQHAKAASAMFGAISATHLVKDRIGFGQIMVPKPGSVLASPERSSYDPDPDYFFHWLRDSSLAMDALRLLLDHPTHGPAAAQAFGDYIGFSLGLTQLSGAARVAQADIKTGVKEDFLRFLRDPDELGRSEGDLVLGETRYNPDGSLDIISWPRPQFDGTAMRALGLLRFRALPIAAPHLAAIDELVAIDLDCTARRWAEPCFDLWEEEVGDHFYTRLIQQAALDAGVAWAAIRGDHGRAERYGTAATACGQSLAGFWDEAQGFYLSRMPGPGTSAEKALDAAVILAVIHVEMPGGRGSVLDPGIQATLLKLEQLFERDYAVNRERPAHCGPLLGRYADDHYYSGGAYMMTTQAAAEFYYKLAAGLAALGPMPPHAMLDRTMLAHLGGGDMVTGQRAPAEQLAQAAVERGDAILQAVRRFAPDDLSMAEQIDQNTGAPASAKNLTWSYGGFLTAIDARTHALALLAEE